MKGNGRPGPDKVWLDKLPRVKLISMIIEQREGTRIQLEAKDKQIAELSEQLDKLQGEIDKEKAGQKIKDINKHINQPTSKKPEWDKDGSPKAPGRRLHTVHRNDMSVNRTTITSPVAGTILKRHVWNEKMVTAGAPLPEIGDLEELEVTADILTEEAVYVHPGDRVVIYGSSLGEKTLPGVIRLVEPQAFTKISSLGVEEQRVAVKVSFTKEAKTQIEKAKLNLGLRYRIRVKIITKEKPSILTVPRTALFIGKNHEWQLYRINDGKARFTQVNHRIDKR